MSLRWRMALLISAAIAISYSIGRRCRGDQGDSDEIPISKRSSRS